MNFLYTFFDVVLMQPLTSGLILCYRLFGQNLGIAILVFSVALIFLLRPLTKPYLESMKKIKAMEPQMAKIKKKYGSDKMKISQAQAELYKENKVNPAAGCLPYILQFIILIALFRVFTGVLTGNVITNVDRFLYTPLKFTQNETLNTKFWYLDITKPDKLKLLIPGIPDFIPGIFVILAALAQFASVKITAPYLSEEEKMAKKTKGGADDMQVAMTQSMTYTLPLITLYFGLTFSSGIALYWLVFSVVSAWQQVGMNGWGSLTPFAKRLGLVK